MNLLPIALGAAGVYWYLHKKEPYEFQAVTGAVTKKPWLTRVLKVQGTGDAKVTTVELWAPKGSWGPHEQLLVATYQQTGSDKSTRKVLGYGPDALPAMITAAGQDFGISKPATSVSGISSPDFFSPLYSRQGKRLGSLSAYHDGKKWQWIASTGTRPSKGRPLALGQAPTLRRARMDAARKANARAALAR